MSLTEVSLVCIAGVFAPQALEICGANRAICLEHAVKLLEVDLYKDKNNISLVSAACIKAKLTHDSGGVSVAAQINTFIIERTSNLEVS